MIEPSQPAYQSFILRLWHSPGAPTRRVSVECITTGELRHFGDVGQLLDYLLALTGPGAPPPLESAPERNAAG